MTFKPNKTVFEDTKALYILVVFSALLLSASYYPLDLGFLAWFALTPFLYALQRSSFRQTVGLSFVFGYLYGAAIFQWLPGVDGVGWPIYLFLLAPLFSLYYVVFGLSYRWADEKLGAQLGALTPLLLLLAPALWVTVEYTRANMFFLSLPLNLLGHTQHAYIPVIQIADITGVYGVSFVIVLVNEALSRWPEYRVAGGKRTTQIARKPPAKLRWSVSFPLAILILMLFYGIVRLREKGSEELLRVAIIQPGAVVTDAMTAEERYSLLQFTSDFTLEAEKDHPDIIVWPASSLPGSLFSRAVKVPVRELIRRTNSHLLVGGSGAAKMSLIQGGGRRYANTEFFLSPEGRLEGQYHKVGLVPFNEYLPLDGKVRWPKWITTLGENFTPGQALTLFRVKQAVFGAPICWESLFPDLFRQFVKSGANLMINPNNEAYMGETAGPYQSMAMTVFRAVENRVAIARASSTGISAFIDPDGRIVEQIQDNKGKKLFVSGIIVSDVPLSEKKTFYTKFGDVFAFVTIGFSFIFVLVTLAFLIRERIRPEF